MADRVLWGLPMLIWARIGKALQFFGALVIVVDIIGPDRLVVFGNSLHRNRVFLSVPKNIYRDLIILRRWKIDDMPEPRNKQANIDYQRVTNYRAIGLLIGTPLLIGLVFLWQPEISKLSGWLRGLIGLSLIPISIILGPYVILGFLGSILFVGFLCNILVLKPLAWCISRPGASTGLKLLSLALIVTGFHFDLLAT